MNSIRWILPLAAVILLSAVPVTVIAQGKPKPNNNQQDERRENQRVKQAQQALDEAQEKHKEAAREVTAASQKLTKVEAEKRQAIDKAQEVRRQLEQQQEVRLGLPGLLKEQEAAQKIFDAAAAPVLAALKASQAYATAVADAKAAHAELQAARRENPSTSVGSDSDLSGLVRRTLKPAELEQAALVANPAAQGARGELAKVQERIQAAREKIRSAVERDAALRGALEDLKQRNAAADKAKAELARSRERLAAAAGKVSQEREQLARAAAADRRDDNKNKQRNNKPADRKKK
jgi:hypothetical protein